MAKLFGLEFVKKKTGRWVQSYKGNKIEKKETSKGNEIKLDNRFLNSDLKIVTGLVEPHFMAGYSGGRKVIAPGIAHASTITKFHSAKYMENINFRRRQTNIPIVNNTTVIYLYRFLEFL